VLAFAFSIDVRELPEQVERDDAVGFRHGRKHTELACRLDSRRPLAALDQGLEQGACIADARILTRRVGLHPVLNAALGSIAA
jgi:hypothetical protein